MALTMPSARTLQDVALVALQSLRDRKKFRQVDLAKRLNTAPAAVSETLSGKRRVTLRFIEAVSELTGMHPGELLADPHRDQLKIVNPQEMQMLRYFRTWPASTREALLSFASFFADEDPVFADQRRAHEQIRQLPDGKKHVVYAYLTYMTEGLFPGGDLPPDIRTGLGLPETNGKRSKRTRKATPKTTTTQGRP